MLLSETKKGTYSKFGQMQILTMNEGDYMMALRHEGIKRTNVPPFDAPVEPSNKEDFLKEIELAVDLDDWYSMLLKDLAKTT